MGLNAAIHPTAVMWRGLGVLLLLGLAAGFSDSAAAACKSTDEPGEAVTTEGARGFDWPLYLQAAAKSRDLNQRARARPPTAVLAIIEPPRELPRGASPTDSTSLSFAGRPRTSAAQPRAPPSLHD